MKRYKVGIEVLQEWTVYIDSETPEDAMELAESMDVDEIKMNGDFESEETICNVFPVEVYDE